MKAWYLILTVMCAVWGCDDSEDNAQSTTDLGGSDTITNDVTSEDQDVISADQDVNSADQNDTSTNDDSSVDTSRDATSADSDPTDTTDMPQDMVFTGPLGGDRPVEALLPDNYDPETEWPLVILLHGFGSSGVLQDFYFDFSSQRTTLGFIAMVPDGTPDQDDDLFWNATPSCCDLFGSGVDDVAYLSGLVEEAQQRYSIDPNSIHFIGHNNGGFMSYRMACEHGDQIASIASLGGSTFQQGSDCTNPGNVSVLQIHGDADPIFSYTGKEGDDGYPSALDTVTRWASRNGCGDTPVVGTPLDLDSGLGGDETTVSTWTGCDVGTEMGLWTIVDGDHLPMLTPAFITESLGFLLAHKRQE